MKRILLRARKGPFDVASADETLDYNLIGGNSGDLLWTQATYKLLATGGAHITVDRYRAHGADADRINEQYDIFVVPLSNAFRIRFERQLIRLTRLIKRLRIPVVVLGVGAQSDLDYNPELLRPIERSVRDFAKVVLDHSPSIGVRGEFTQSYLQGLGFRDVEVIGCPSMFLYGDQMVVQKKVPRLDRDSRLAILVTPEVESMGEVITRHLERFPNLTYIPQDLSDLAMLLWQETPRTTRSREDLPFHTAHPLVRENKIRFFLDPWTWLDYLRDVDFAFGTRMHGAIAALLAGTPAYVMAHDSRTLELARYFEIPHRTLRGPMPVIDAAELYGEADYSALQSGHSARFERLVDFIHRHGLEHAFASPVDAEAFDLRVRATPYPPPVDARAILAGGHDVPLGRRLHYWGRRVKRNLWVARFRARLLRLFSRRL